MPYICLMIQSPDLIKAIFNQGKGYAYAKNLRQAGIDFYQIKKMLADHSINQVKRGLYKWADLPGAATDFPELARVIPNGVICLFSACQYHNLGDYIPFEHHIAVSRHRKIKRPVYPPIQLYYWSPNQLEAGIEHIQTPQGDFLITDLEKTVCDMVKYRNKTGKDLVAKILRDYIQHPKRNLNRIMAYARVVRVEKILTNYLDALL
jgi:predicted transcriptional regulator of viral defense system